MFIDVNCEREVYLLYLQKRASFLKAMQAVDAAGEAFEKEEQRMGYRDEKTFKAAEQRLEQAQEKGKAAEKEYLDAVNLANGLARDVFQNHLPPMLDVLQFLLVIAIPNFLLSRNFKLSSFNGKAHCLGR